MVGWVGGSARAGQGPKHPPPTPPGGGVLKQQPGWVGRGLGSRQRRYPTARATFPTSGCLVSQPPAKALVGGGYRRICVCVCRLHASRAWGEVQGTGSVGCPPTAVGYAPTAVGYPPIAIGLPPTAAELRNGGFAGHSGTPLFFSSGAAVLLWAGWGGGVVCVSGAPGPSGGGPALRPLGGAGLWVECPAAPSSPDCIPEGVCGPGSGWGVSSAT